MAAVEAAAVVAVAAAGFGGECSVGSETWTREPVSVAAVAVGVPGLSGCLRLEETRPEFGRKQASAHAAATAAAVAAAAVDVCSDGAAVGVAVAGPGHSATVAGAEVEEEEAVVVAGERRRASSLAGVVAVAEPAEVAAAAAAAAAVGCRKAEALCLGFLRFAGPLAATVVAAAAGPAAAAASSVAGKTHQ